MDGCATLLCALILLAHSGREVAAINIESNSATDFLVGRNINLSISYNYTENTSVNWYKNESLLLKWDKVITAQVAGYNGRLNITGFGSLVISNSTTDDSGSYRVNVDAIGQIAGVLIFPVKVYDPVNDASVSQSPNAVDESTPVVNLTCNASSGGLAFVWTRDGQSLSINGSFVTLDGGRTLQINLPNRTHSGNYSCNVSNPVDWEKASRMLNVSYSVNSSSLSGGAIAGIVIGAVCGAILLIALIIIAIFCIRKKRKGEKEKNPAGPHKAAIRTISGSTLSPDDPAYFTLNNIMYRNSSISMGSYVMNYGDSTSDYLRNPSPNPPPSQPKVKKATQV
ncbi:cell adhesion molecule CEACAM1-like [Rhinoderma darwinii]|uniref:cell adhesion molecule CEACAM1-like n=1 Tax=Rhinoderma darwinii TaxID=43563 RepID=UPI003F66F6E1